jgi:hypothetical protein
MSGNIIDMDPKQRMRRSLAYFLDGISVEERMEMMRLLQQASYEEGYAAGLTKAKEIFATDQEPEPPHAA